MKSIFSVGSRRTNRARTSREAWGAAVRKKCIGLSQARSAWARLASLYPNRRVSGTNFEFMGIESFRGSVASMAYSENKMIARTLGRTSSRSPMPPPTRWRRMRNAFGGEGEDSDGGMQEVTATVPAGTAAKRLSATDVM